MLAIVALAPALVAKPIRVACVGDSITYGLGLQEKRRLSFSYPGRLQALLGGQYQVKMFAKPGCTLMNLDWLPPFISLPEYTQSQKFQPDVVCIMLGTNDSHPRNWEKSKRFKSDYAGLISSYRRLPSKPKIIVVSPPHLGGLAEKRQVQLYESQTLPQIAQIAKTAKAVHVTTYSVTRGKQFHTPDGIHISELGCARIAQRVAPVVQSIAPAPSAR